MSAGQGLILYTSIIYLQHLCLKDIRTRNLYEKYVGRTRTEITYETRDIKGLLRSLVEKTLYKYPKEKLFGVPRQL